MTKTPYPSRQNSKVELGGQEIYISRACAAVGQVFLYSTLSKQWHILLGKRGSGAPDFNGYWCMPCGYLDWDESLYHAFLRETWEETGVDLVELMNDTRTLKSEGLADPKAQPEPSPWFISDGLTTKRQNISFNFCAFIVWSGEDLPELSAENCEENEVEDVSWMPVARARTTQLAFNHSQRLESILVEKNSVFKSMVYS